MLLAANIASEHVKYRSMHGEIFAQFDVKTPDSPVKPGGLLFVTGKLDGELVIASKKFGYTVLFTLSQLTFDQPVPAFDVDCVFETKTKYTGVSIYRRVQLNGLRLLSAPSEARFARYAGWNDTLSLHACVAVLLGNLW